MTIIHLLDEQQTLAAIDDLSEILSDCVEGGASVGFMSPFSAEDAVPYWRDTAAAVGRGEILLFVAELDGRIAGTVQIGLASRPNQLHRADLMKLLVHTRARGKGLARALMDAAEQGAAKKGRGLLVLDTATGEASEAVYAHLGWQKVGTIPNYALFPDGRFCGTTLFYKTLVHC